jgi:hypothetical protein
MTTKYKNTPENKKEVYFFLGLLSTLFAKMEADLLKILGKLITSDFVLANTLFERNTLAQNIEMVKKISDLKQYEVKTIKGLTDKISNIKKTRNLFIHGVWSEPIEKDNDIIITCRESKLDYWEDFENGIRMGRTWCSNKRTEIRLSYMRKLVDKVEEIILIEEHLLKKLEDYDYIADL